MFAHVEFTICLLLEIHPVKFAYVRIYSHFGCANPIVNLNAAEHGPMPKISKDFSCKSERRRALAHAQNNSDGGMI